MKNNHHIVKSFGAELEVLVRSLNEMKNLVISLVVLSEKSLEAKDRGVLDLARAEDKKINDYEKKIESNAISLLALRQPMAGDLRFIVSAIKIASLLERIGDRGKKTIKKVERLSAPIPAEILNDIKEMNKIIINMIEEVFVNIEKYQFTDLKKAYHDDNKVDEFYSDTIKKALKLQESDPDPLPEFIAKIKILKNYERIGDYATKIAKIVYYIAEGSTSPNF
jgi:phosphate transport system protein